MNMPARVSVHGGHSGQFCHHASDSLEKIVQAYIEKEYSWVGITEHTPPIREDLLYPDEKKAGLMPDDLNQQFSEYIKECRRLQEKYRDQITLFVGMEIETYSGYEQLVTNLLEKFCPDYIVGSVHFVDDIPFDYSQEEYGRAVRAVGGIESLYCRYFDQQYAMLQRLMPAVVGHFDLIRLFDPDYETRLQHPDIVSRIDRNLMFIEKNNLILDYNLRALLKGAKEPYVSRTILEKARDLGIAVVPGDDAHGVDSVGHHIDEASAELALAGFNTDWQRPKLYRFA
jgi:histidinol-phosphatase (PHP family)